MPASISRVWSYYSSACQMFVLFAALIWLIGLSAHSAARADERPHFRLETGGHTAQVQQVLFTQDGRLLSVGLDKAVRVWKLNAGALSGALAETTYRYQSDDDGTGRFWCAALDPKTQLLAVGENSGDDVDPILIIDWQHDGKLVKRLQGCKRKVIALAFSPDGTQLAAADTEGTICVYDTTSWKSAILHPGSSQILCLAFSPDDRQLAAGTAGKSVLVWDAHSLSQRPKERKGIKLGSVQCLDWSSKGDLAAGDDTGQIVVWPQDGAPFLVQKMEVAVESLSFSPNGEELATGMNANAQTYGEVRLWSVDKDNPRQLRDPFPHSAPVTAVQFSSDGKQIACGDGAGDIKVWDLQLHQVEQDLRGAGRPAFYIAWSTDSAKVVWADELNGDYSKAFDLKNMVPAAMLQQAQIAKNTRISVDMITGVDSNLIEKGYVIAGPNADAFVPLITGEVLLCEGKKVLHRFIGSQGVALGLAVSPDGQYLAGGFSDQTVRIWSLNDPAPEVQPLLCLYMGSDNEWVAWNQQKGYYTASPMGDDIITWQINQGANQRAEMLTAFQCRDTFYRPTALRDLFATGTLDKLPAASLQQQILKLPVIDNIEPEGAEKQGDLYVTNQPDVTLRVHLKSTGSPVTAIRVLVNHTGGRAIGVVEQAAQPDEWQTQADLSRGMNSLLVLVQTSDGWSRPYQLTIRYEGGDPTQLGDLYVLSIGVKEYQDTNLNLQYSDKDASDIAEVFRQQQGQLYAHVNTTLLVNQDATKAKIEDAVKSLQGACKSEDTLVIFVAGHGFAQGSEQQGNGAAPPDYYFAPYDFQLKQQATTGVSWNVILEQLSQIKAHNIILFADQCFAGGVNRDAQSLLASNNIERSLRNNNIITLVASTADQSSWEDKTWHHGVYTYALLQALTGAGEAQKIVKNGVVDLEGVSYYVSTTVPDLVHQFGVNTLHVDNLQQKPRLYTFSPDTPLDIPLAKITTN